MSDFINTAEVIGDDQLTNSIINRTVTEYCDDSVGIIGGSAFASCEKLVTVNCPKVKHTNLGRCAFQYCKSLKTVNFDTENLGVSMIYQQYVFEGCSSLEEFTLSGNPSQSMFANCTALKKVDVIVGNINSYGCFQNCSSLVTFILRQTGTIHSLGSVAHFSGTPIESGTGCLYVPRSLVDTYKSATNWSTYADQFRALEDYTVDGTTTGELDETKI